MRLITRNILVVVLFFAPCVQAQVGDSTRIAVLSDSQDPTFVEPFVLKMPGSLNSGLPTIRMMR